MGCGCDGSGCGGLVSQPEQVRFPCSNRFPWQALRIPSLMVGQLADASFPAFFMLMSDVGSV